MPSRSAGGLSSPAGLHRRPWLARLRRALAEDLFVLHYQPIVSLEDGRVSHYEALVRLADEPDGRLVAPGEFLPAAERYGLIREIDRMVLGKVAALLGEQIARERSAWQHRDQPVGPVGHRRRDARRHRAPARRLAASIPRGS